MDKLSNTSTEQEIQEVLSDIHNKYALKVNDHIIRIAELEYYPWDDPFTHKNEMQKRDKGFYVHRSGKTKDSKYKGGSFKGLDIVCNGGFLIRAIEYEDKIIEGPCNTVNKLCELGEWELEELETNLELIPYTWPVRNPIYGARGGLTLKKAKSDTIFEMARHLIMPRRSAIYVPTKYKENFFVSNIDRTDIKHRSKKRFKQEYEEGKVLAKEGTLSSDMTIFQILGYLS